MMRTLLLVSLGIAAACTTGQAPPGDDSADNPDGGGGGGPDSGGSATCKVPPSTGDLGAMTPGATEQRNQPGSQGTRKLYRTYVDVGGDRFQIELWDQTGAFAGTTVHTGTFPLTGADADWNQCGVCAIAVGDTTQPFIGTAGSVTVTAVGGPGTTLAVSMDGVTFSEVDPTTFALESGGCSGTLAGVDLSGTIVFVDGGGGGGGGGGG